MNLFQEAKEVLDKSGKVNPLGPYGRSKLTGREVATYFRNNKVKDAKIKKAVEVALDLGGADSIARKEIKKFYGDKILKSKEVQNALRYANESVEFTFDMINEDEVKVDHENPKDRADQKKFRKIIQLGKQAKIKLLDGGGRGYRAQGNRAQVQKFKQLVSKEFGNSVSMSESINLSKNRIGDKQKKSVDQVRRDMNKSVDDANQKLRDAMRRKKEKEARMRQQQREAKKLDKEVEKVKENKKFNEFDTVRKMWEDALEKKNLKESSESIEEGQFYGQDGMNKAAKKMFNKKTHIKLVKDKGSYQSATISRKDKKKIAQLKKDGYKEVSLESVNENYRKLAQYGMGTETSKSARVGLELDFYDSKGNKQFGKILQRTNTGYLVKDDKGKKHVLKYLDRKKAAKMLKPNYVHTESINEVTDKEINMAKKLSKDMEKVKKGYQQIAKTGDKTLKNTGFNPTYEAILKAQQKVLSLIGELNTMKIMSDRAASRQKDSKGRPIMNSFDTYRLMQDSEHIELIEDKVLKFTKVKDKSLEKHLKFVTKKVGAKLEKIAGGFQVSDTDMKGFTAVVDYIFDKSIKKNMLDGGGMSDVNMVNEGKYSKYSDLLLKKQRMPDNADKTQINKQISKERQKLNMSMWEDAIEENIERGIMKKMRRGRVAKGMPR